MFVRIFYLKDGRNEKVVTWKRSKAECGQFIKKKGGEMLKVIKHDGKAESRQS